MAIERFFRSAGIYLLCFVSAFLVLIFSWLPKGGVYPFVSQKMWGPGLLWLAGAKLSVEGLENIQGKDHGVYYSNHSSLFDIPAITSAIPTPLYFIAKKEMQNIPIFGWGMHAIGMVFVDRANRERAIKSMKKAAKVVSGGKSLITFPEGTRSKSGKLNSYKKGTFHLAKNGNIDLIPLAVIGSRAVLSPGGKLQWGQKITVVVGKPIDARKIAIMNQSELTAYAHSETAKLLASAEQNWEQMDITKSLNLPKL